MSVTFAPTNRFYARVMWEDPESAPGMPSIDAADHLEQLERIAEFLPVVAFTGGGKPLFLSGTNGLVTIEKLAAEMDDPVATEGPHQVLVYDRFDSHLGPMTEARKQFLHSHAQFAL
ncbi:hypothetical protein [Amycolatopsis viridis]|uniref:Uncharacterized protein n=1 Tax=Amycolatopsis viridis TaxID=185678 RepID=A0ABX0T1D3_9PSEU|nr:hypothetical protein [Amycolatopsis viridis]NIH81704.1 hypothetical protein [Amycolatopsis viridis]